MSSTIATAATATDDKVAYKDEIPLVVLYPLSGNNIIIEKPTKPSNIVKKYEKPEIFHVKRWANHNYKDGWYVPTVRCPCNFHQTLKTDLDENTGIMEMRCYKCRKQIFSQLMEAYPAHEVQMFVDTETKFIWYREHVLIDV